MVKNPKYTFKCINRTKPSGHSANELVFNEGGMLVAVRCNCGKKKYHPVSEEGDVFWEAEDATVFTSKHRIKRHISHAKPGSHGKRKTIRKQAC